MIIENNLDKIRQLRIDLITDTYNPIIEWFDELWSRIRFIETNVYHKNGGEIIYFIIVDNKKVPIFFRNDTKDIFWYSMYNYCYLLETQFNIDYDSIQDITRILVENATSEVIAIPSKEWWAVNVIIQNALNKI